MLSKCFSSTTLSFKGFKVKKADRPITVLTHQGKIIAGIRVKDSNIITNYKKGVHVFFPSETDLEFELINFTDYMLNMNLMYKNTQANCIDPGPTMGLNAVNEIRPNTAYVVRRNQSTGKTMKIKEAGGATFDQAEAKSQNLEFYLSVIPQKGHDLTGAEWTSTDYVVIEDTLFQGLEQSFGAPAAQTRGFGGFDAAMSIGGAPAARGFGAASATRGIAAPTAIATPAAMTFGTATGFGASPAAMSIGAAPAARGFGAAPAARGFGAATAARGFGAAPAAPVGGGFSAMSEAFASSNAVGQSKAVSMVDGESINEHVCATGHEYNFEGAATVSRMTFSILDVPQVGEDVDPVYLAGLINKYVEAKNGRIAQDIQQVYDYPTCVVDLTSPADTVLCMCGHKCVSKAAAVQLKKCPICRAPIKARLPSEALP